MENKTLRGNRFHTVRLCFITPHLSQYMYKQHIPRLPITAPAHLKGRICKGKIFKHIVLSLLIWYNEKKTVNVFVEIHHINIILHKYKGVFTKYVYLRICASHGII